MPNVGRDLSQALARVRRQIDEQQDAAAEALLLVDFVLRDHAAAPLRAGNPWLIAAARKSLQGLRNMDRTLEAALDHLDALARPFGLATATPANR
jgi:hypothetical protein